MCWSSSSHHWLSSVFLYSTNPSFEKGSFHATSPFFPSGLVLRSSFDATSLSDTSSSSSGVHELADTTNTCVSGVAHSTPATGLCTTASSPCAEVLSSYGSSTEGSIWSSRTITKLLCILLPSKPPLSSVSRLVQISPSSLLKKPIFPQHVTCSQIPPSIRTQNSSPIIPLCTSNNDPGAFISSPEPFMSLVRSRPILS